MNPTIDVVSVDAFRALVARRLGLYFEDARLEELEGLLRWRMEVRATPTPSAYLDLLTGGDPGSSSEEWRAIVGKLTVCETYFFRNLPQYQVLAEVLIQKLLVINRDRRVLSLLSAGCSSGEEPYSLAMTVALGPAELSAWDVRIVGIDINRGALAKAEKGRYSSWSLREAPREISERYFSRVGSDFQIEQRIKNMVMFQERNIFEEDPEFWRPELFDVILCRNTTMYFSPDKARAAVARLCRSLRPGGYLFLGHAETLRGISDDFHLRQSHGTFYYQRKDQLGRRAQPPESGRVPTLQPSNPFEAKLEAPVQPQDPNAWVDVIRQAADRIAGLAQASMSPPAVKSVSASTAPRHEVGLGFALDLLRQERYDDALTFIGGLPREAAHTRDVRMLSAVLLANSLRLDEAESACRELLAIDDLNAGAHYIMALCREHASDRAAALKHDQAAVYLDPDFAMPHLHMGLVAKRSGEREAGRRHLSRALALLEREDPGRILLFGGGFTREALIKVCETEISAGAH